MRLDLEAFEGEPLERLIQQVQRVDTRWSRERKRRDILIQRGELLGEPTDDDSVDGGDPTAEDAMERIRAAGGQLGPRPDSPEVDIPNVVLGEFIAEGKQGRMYRGRVRTNDTNNREVAVKVLEEAKMRSGDQAAKEALLAATVDHPNLIRVYLVRQIGIYWVIIMEYVQGDSLNDADLARSRFRATFAQLARALIALGRADIVHRDVKPANIILRSADLSPVLVDFGLAVKVDQFEPGADSAFAGSPVFMPSEAFNMERPEPSWDAYSLGVTAAYLALGKDLPRPDKAPGSNRSISSLKLSGEFETAVIQRLAGLGAHSEHDWIEPLLDAWHENRMKALENLAFLNGSDL